MEIEPTEQTNLTNEINQTNNWLEEELKQQEQTAEYEKVESMKFPEDKVTEVTVDISKAWDVWVDSSTKPPTTKKIIPVLHDGVHKNWWLNVRNPLYKEVREKGIAFFEAGKTEFIVQVFRTGQMKNTRYRLVK